MSRQYQLDDLQNYDICLNCFKYLHSINLYELRRILHCFRHLDFINLMSYDLHGSWEPQTGHQSALYQDTGETAPESYLNVVKIIVFKL